MLAIEDLTKTYSPPRGLLRPLVRSAAVEPVNALRGVSLDVAGGEVVGLVGPNGAGKTTLLRVIGTLLEPTSGRVAVAGFDTVEQAQEVRRRIGLGLSDDRGLYWRLTGRQNLEFFGVLAGLRPPIARQQAGRLLDLMDLSNRDKRVFGYSAGMRSRLNLARALLADPQLVVLDEPTVNLDPLAATEVGAHLRKLADQGRGVLLSSHRMDEVVAVCDRVVVLIDGTVRFAGRPAELSVGETPTATALGDFLASQANPG